MRFNNWEHCYNIFLGSLTAPWKISVLAWFLERQKRSKGFFFYRLLIKIIDFYFPLFYYCLMTSAGGNVTQLSHEEIKLNYNPPKYFRGFFIGKLRIFYHRLLVISKYDKIVYNKLFREITGFTSPRVPLTNLACKISLRSCYFAGQNIIVRFK